MSAQHVAWRSGALVLILGVTLLAGCVTAKHTTGVNNYWRASDVEFTVGQTREQDVLDALGPPSQLIALHEYTVYYYLLEESDKKGIITIIYNANTQDVVYDRVIFFFDKHGVLQRWAKSKECLPLRQEPQCNPATTANWCS